MADFLSTSAASISNCGRYRWSLSRTWNPAGTAALFVMLNPSTADACADDPTIRRCIAFATGWGHGRLVVANLYAFRATDPRQLPADEAAAIGADNDTVIAELVREASIVVCAWGALERAKPRAAAVLALVRELGATPHCLRMTKGGQPGHPLYLPASLSPIPF